MKIVYISGRITGLPESEAIENFNKAETALLEKGYTVVNPIKINHDHDKTWESYMKEDIKAMCSCDCIYMIDGWEQSRGAKIEYQLAKDLGMELIKLQQ
jgi:hypothetical protein